MKTESEQTQHVLHFPGAPSKRLDVFLAESLSAYSRSQIQRWIKAGRVQVSGSTVERSGERLDQPVEIVLSVPPSEPSKLIPEDIPLDVVFENSDLMVVNKAAGMVVHPAVGHTQGTLVHAALAHAPGMEGVGGVRRPGVVHRLDKLTSGLIILAKNDLTHRFLQAQFRDRLVEKTYLALVDGKPPTPEGRVEAAIGRDISNRKRMRVVPPGRGREAVSEYKTLESFREHTLLEVRPLTGRTHQIRVHLAFLGSPVVGDPVYGRKKNTLGLRRFFLHAARLRLKLPGEGTPHAFEAPLPLDLSNSIELARAR